MHYSEFLGNKENNSTLLPMHLDNKTVNVNMHHHKYSSTVESKNKDVGATADKFS